MWESSNNIKIIIKTFEIYINPRLILPHKYVMSFFLSELQKIDTNILLFNILYVKFKWHAVCKMGYPIYVSLEEVSTSVV